ncbi:unnamed protein product [Coregonus sp. 'balchen']|nr:unnamed protein product [Coregonus sp. 'balchen']
MAQMGLCAWNPEQWHEDGEVDPTPPPSSPSLSQAVGDTDIVSSRGRSSVVGLVPGAGMGATGDLLESFLAQKDRLLNHTGGVVLPSALPQDLLPLLGRGLSVRGLSGGLSLDQPHDSGPLLPSQQSQPDSNPIPSSSQPGTHTSTHTPPGQQDEVTAIVTATIDADTDMETDMDADTPSPVYYRSLPEGGMGMFQLHYQTLCGGSVKNATVGRILSPSPHPGPNATQDRSCSWSMEAPTAQRLHLHLERLALGPTDRLVLWSGLDAGSVVLFDSGRGGPIPFEGVISEGPAVRVQFITDQPNHNTGFNIRYEAFERGHCYEPYLQNGNFSTTDQAYGVGAVVQFSCDTGHSLEQGPPVIECINARDPYWNDTEPLCKALCGGDLAGPGGVILSPNWPEWYGEGEDCSWRIHVGEEKRVLLDVQLLNLSDSDMLTILDGDEVTTHILGQYVGGTGPFKIQSTTPDLTVTFHSDPAGLVFGKGEGFIINYMEVSRNDSCPDLPEIQNGWKTTSHTALVRGARITYQCDPGYDLVGRETLTYPKLLVGTTIQYSCYPGFILQGGATLTCYGREPGTPVWTSKLPHCVSEESVSCENPGLPDNGYQILSKRLYLPSELLTFICYQGYELIGEVAIKCILGNPSFWSGPLPLCRANHDCFGNHALEVVEAAAGSGLDGGNMALAIFILVLLLSVLLGGAYVYITRCRYHSNLPSQEEVM